MFDGRFARARCASCGYDFLVAFSCKGRGACPSCNAKRMAETAAETWASRRYLDVSLLEEETKGAANAA